MCVKIAKPGHSCPADSSSVLALEYLLLLDPGTVISFGVFWEPGTLILLVLLFNTPE